MIVRRRDVHRCQMMVWVAMMVAATTLQADRAAAQSASSPAGTVSVWLAKDPLSGREASLKAGQWQPVVLSDAPEVLSGCPIVASESIVVAFDPQKSTIYIFTRKQDRLKRRGVCSITPAGRPTVYKRAPGSNAGGVGIEAYASSAEGVKAELQYTLVLRPDGLIEFKPASAVGMTLAETPMRYGIAPSFLGTDLVYEPAKCADRKEVFLPSMGFYVGLAEGEDCMMVGVWPPGRQTTRLIPSGQDEKKVFSGFSIDLDNLSFFWTYVESPHIWHAEPLKEEYLEKHTAIGWKRPFPARWIGWFFVESGEMHYPFYFQRGKRKIWGRYISGWYEYPMWFDDDRTMIHFEKEFPPIGDLVIYYLEGPGGFAGTQSAVLSPVEVMRRALGAETAKKLLDIDGVTERRLQEHGLAVCAMSDELGRVFAGGNEAKQKAKVNRLLDDIVTFMRLVRERVTEFGAFARDTQAFLDARTKADSDLTEAFRPAAEKLDEILAKIKSNMPATPLDEVRGWIEQIRSLTDQVHQGSKEKLVVLAHQWRSVAGAQDDVNRDVSVITIGVMEAAAKAGIGSAKRAALAEELIEKCRKVLRHGATWEPRRVYIPGITPG